MKLDNIVYDINKSNYNDIIEHLKLVDNNFIPNLSSTINLEEYAQKIFSLSERYECWHSKNLIGLIAIYNNYENIPFSYITNVSVLESYMGIGIAKKLMQNVSQAAKNRNIPRIDLHVNNFNIKAIYFYKKFDFKIISENDNNTFMSLSF